MELKLTLQLKSIPKIAKTFCSLFYLIVYCLHCDYIESVVCNIYSNNCVLEYISSRSNDKLGNIRIVHTLPAVQEVWILFNHFHLDIDVQGVVKMIETLDFVVIIICNINFIFFVDWFYNVCAFLLCLGFDITFYYACVLTLLYFFRGLILLCLCFDIILFILQQ